jgi:hypothetical protein
MEPSRRTCGCRGRSPSSSPSTAGGTRPPHPARPSGAGNRRSHHERWPLFSAPAPSRPLSAPPGRRRKAHRAFSCLPRPSVSLLPAPAAGSTCPMTSGSRPCRGCPSGPSRTSRWSRHPPRRHRRSPSPASRPATPAPSVWQTAFRPALTCSLVSSQGLRPGCSRKQCPDEPAPSLRPHYTGISATTGRSAGAHRDGTQHLAASGGLVRSLSPRSIAGAVSARAFPCFRTQAADQARATCTPGTAWPAIRASARLLPGRALSPRFRCRFILSALQRWFTRVRLPGPRLTALTPPFPHRSPRQSSASAACGGLTPPPAGRRRRATKPSSCVQQAHQVIASYSGDSFPRTRRKMPGT